MGFRSTVLGGKRFGLQSEKSNPTGLLFLLSANMSLRPYVIRAVRAICLPKVSDRWEAS